MSTLPCRVPKSVTKQMVPKRDAQLEYIKGDYTPRLLCSIITVSRLELLLFDDLREAVVRGTAPQETCSM